MPGVARGFRPRCLRTPGVGEIRVYSVSDFGMMIADRVRMDAYAAALEAAVTPGCTVFDIGAGTGVLSLLACRFGAAHVYAIDPNPAVALVAENAARNGVGHKVTVIPDLTTNFFPERRADVIVSDLRGVLPFLSGHIETLADASQRLLAPGGVLIPACDRVYAAIVTAPERYSRLTAGWVEDRYGLELTSGRAFALNNWVKDRFRPEQLLTPPRLARTIEYAQVTEADARFTAELEWTVETAGVAHGVGLWFDTDLFGSIGFSNGPGEPDSIYGRALFPWLEPVAMTVGTRIQARVEAWPIDGEYVWRWEARVWDASGAEVARFDQSTFKGSPPNRRRLQKGASSHIPSRNREVELDSFVLAQIDGQSTLRDIASRVVARFPGAFVGERAALDYVARCSRRY